MPEVKCPKCPNCGGVRTGPMGSCSWTSDGELGDLFSCDSIRTDACGFSHTKACRIRQLESTVSTLRKALEDIRDNPGLGSQLRLMAGKVLEETK